MKKTLIGLIGVLISVVMIVSFVLSVNVELNLRIRRKIHELYAPYDIVDIAPTLAYLRADEILETAHTEHLFQLKNETGKTFFDLFWLRDAMYTYHYDEMNNQLNLVGPEYFIIIDAFGNVTINGESTDRVVQTNMIEGAIYIAYEDLMQLPNYYSFGIKLRKVTDNQNIFFMSDHVEYSFIDLNRGELIFDSLENMESFSRKLNAYSSYYNFRAILEPHQILEKVQPQKAIAYLTTEGMRVVTEENSLGYIRNGLNRKDQVTSSVNLNVEPSALDKSDRIMLVWEAVYSFNPDTDLIPEMPGVNVVSPTWYELSDAEGNVSSKVSTNYIEWAQNNNYQIWALVSNEFNIDRTHAFLKNASARERFINKLIEESLTYGYQGINVDFENVYLADKDNLTHFINELAFEMRKHDLILSMDVTIMGGSDNWSKCYDHEYLGKIVDYLIIMAYDEHWASSPISGPVASYGWVSRSMRELVQVVEPHKLILGLPFYTRVWRETPSLEAPNQMTTRSSAIGMTAQNNFIVNNELTPIWDERSKLYFSAFIDGDNLVKIWIENPTTLGHKAELVNELDLAGIAGWQRSLASDDVWEPLRKIIFD